MSWRTNGTRVEDGDGRLVAYLTPWSTEADARKIAAVDDMLAALKALVEVAVWDADTRDERRFDAAFSKAEAAIQQAEGK